MNKVTDIIQKKLVPLANKFAQNKYLASLSETMMTVMPLIVVGSFACLFASINIGPWQAFLANNPSLMNAFLGIQAWTINMIGVYVLFVLSYKNAKKLGIEPLIASILTAAVFFMLTPAEMNVSISHEWLGYKGMITAIVLGMVVPAFAAFLQKANLTIKLPESVPEFVQTSFSSLIPVVIIVAITAVINVACRSLGNATLPEIVYQTLQIPFSNATSSLLATVLFMGGCALFMSMGIHANTLLYVIFPFYMANSAANLEAYQANLEIPNIVTGSFFMHIVIGGIGCILPLVILLVTVTKSDRLKSVGKLALVPSLFNISEPVLFGAPILFNPVLMLPYIGCSMLNAAIGYLSIASGIVPKLPGIEVVWSTPCVLSGFLAQGWQFALLQVVLFVLDLLIYLPFVKAYDKNVLSEEAANKE